ncbi:DUF4832 domain-containing protein [Chitinophaga defluvii]|uniref:DUF4832 domain-containing protein n=1 Tax=Chitinophaga defluvii TaxID=3163343 RepID=A0ABV2T0R3_9BACT
MKQLLFILLAIAAISFRAGTNKHVLKVKYTASEAVFANPERGFYRQFSINPAQEELLDTAALKSVKRNGNSLILFYCYLKAYRNEALPEKMLLNFEKNMQLIQQAGLKCILRFSYTSSMDAPDAPLKIVLQHLDQLQPMLTKHAGVIALMQAGFIGAWGEFHTSAHELNTPDRMTQIIDKILEVLPANRMVQVRTPFYKTQYLQSMQPLSKAAAFSDSKAARIGHHNDCFLASTDDYGTYHQVTAEKQYLHAEGIFVPVGGETCPPEGIAPADCMKAQQEMRYLRWSFLNEGYYNAVLHNWQQQGCMDSIKRQLGYRFELLSGEFTAATCPGGTLQVAVRLVNRGYASLYNPRPVELILQHTSTGERYHVQLPDDPRYWSPQQVITLTAIAGIPGDTPAGVYKLLLSLPAPEKQLYGHPDYAIRFANQDVWQEKSGFNDLHATIRINSTVMPPKHTGSLYFINMQNQH